MNLITIPRQTIAKDDLVVIPRKEYETLLRFQTPMIKEVVMTKQQKSALQRARKNLAQGRYLSIHELKRKLEITS